MLEKRILLENKLYTLKEVTALLDDLVRFANGCIDGELVLRRVTSGHWVLEYKEDKTEIERARLLAQREVRRTADYIEELTGKRPPWG
jgi:hypothetical protein